MKKTALFAFAAAMLFLTTSCNKSDSVTPVTQTVSASLKSNETYTFSLPANNTDDAYQITTQALNSSVSQISPSADGSLMYQYTPVANFTGTEAIVISTVEENHTTCDKGKKPPLPLMHGDCKNHEHCQQAGKIIKINLTVLPGTK